MKVLVADDDADLRELIAFTLMQAGHLVVKAGDGPAALRHFGAEGPDLVLLDINMPGLSGFQVCETIRARSRVPVMMLTVRGEEEDLVRALGLGADAHHAVLGGELVGVGQQVDEHLGEPRAVAREQRQLLGNRDRERLAALREERGDHGGGIRDHVGDRHGLAADRELAGFDAHALEEVVDELRQAARAAL